MSNLKYIWLAVSVLALILTGFIWFGFDSQILQNTILALDALMFILSLPCSLFFVPVAMAAKYFLEIDALAGSGIYLNTVFLFVIGLLQWFWIVRFWYPTESVFQQINLLDANSE